MVSQKQLAANRRNALKSTGPRTPQGKAAVRLNALRHGLRARSLLLPGENIEELHQLCAGLQADWRPRNHTEQLLVEQMAVAYWKLARLEVGERSILRQDMPAERQLALLDRFSMQRARLERGFSKTLWELEKLQRNRPSRQAQPARVEVVAPVPGIAAARPAATEPAPILLEFPHLMSDLGAGLLPPLVMPAPALSCSR
jgi:hypothetical protein